MWAGVEADVCGNLGALTRTERHQFDASFVMNMVCVSYQNPGSIQDFGSLRIDGF